MMKLQSLFLFIPLLLLGTLFAQDSANPCAAILCLENSECDSLTGECVPVNCDNPFACTEEGDECVPETRFCVRAPCPQFTCLPSGDEDFSGCYDSCENKVNPFKLFVDECSGKKCFCLAYDKKLCYGQQDCIFCTQVYPECDVSCQNCTVHKQTCTKCAYAQCLDD